MRWIFLVLLLGCARPKEDVPFGELVARAGRVELPADSRAKYEGTYDLTRTDGRTLTIVVRSEPQGLTAQTPNGTMHLVYRGEDTFSADFDPAMRIVIAKGAMRLVQGGVTWEGPRRP